LTNEFAISLVEKSEVLRAVLLDDKSNGPFLIVVVDIGVGRRI
jgi:hypothetical protein